jgi:hypothetical protein
MTATTREGAATGVRGTSTPRGRDAVVAALSAHLHGPDGHHPWVPAATLANIAGASSPDDPHFAADVLALAAAGAIRLMSFGGAGFLEAMLMPAEPLPEPPAD